MPTARRPTSPVLTAAAAVAAAVAFAPVAWLVCATVKAGDDVDAYWLLPWHHLDRLTASNYARLFADHPFAAWMTNSLLIASAQTVAAVVLANLAGFAVAKYDFPGRRAVLAILLSLLLLPHQVLLPSSYELMRHLHLLDTYWAVLLPGVVSVFGLFLFDRAMRQVPDDLLAAARIDGCSELRLWWDVAAPLVRPTTAAFALLSFAASWNAFLWPQIVLNDSARYTLPLGLASLTATAGLTVGPGVVLAGTLLGAMPVVVLFFALQRDFVPGLTAGGVKG